MMSKRVRMSFPPHYKAALKVIWFLASYSSGYFLMPRCEVPQRHIAEVMRYGDFTLSVEKNGFTAL